MNDLANIEIPASVTVSCPDRRFQQRYLHKGCLQCEHFKGVTALTDAFEKEVKDQVTGIVLRMRPIEWHEKYMIRCSFAMTRRCSNMAIVEE